MLKDSVLLIEDDPETRSLLTEVLESDGYKTRAVSNGEEALRWLREHTHKPCLILLDLLMPVMHGQEFIETLRNEFADAIHHFHVVIMSAGRNLELQPVAAPVIGHIQKPFRLGELLLVVENHCDKVALAK